MGQTSSQITDENSAIDKLYSQTQDGEEDQEKEGEITPVKRETENDAPAQSTAQRDPSSLTPKRNRSSFEIRIARPADVLTMGQPLNTPRPEKQNEPAHPAKRKRTSEPANSSSKEDGHTPKNKKQKLAESNLKFRPGHVSAVNGKKTGWFSPEEVKTLENFKAEFCNSNHISPEAFDASVQSSLKDKSGIFETDYPPMTYKEFWTAICALIPDRDRRSTTRFMRRHFQSGEKKPHQWAPEDDDELENLHQKYGPKWALIAKEMQRTHDDVVQRWKNKVEHRSTLKGGNWAEDEIDRLLEALEATHKVHVDQGEKAKVGKDIYEMDDQYISWGAISDRLGNTRTRQQCADKWRKIRRAVEYLRARGDKNAVYAHNLPRKPRATPSHLPVKSAERLELSSDEESDTSDSESDSESDSDSDSSDTSSEEGSRTSHSSTGTSNDVSSKIAPSARPSSQGLGADKLNGKPSPAMRNESSSQSQSDSDSDDDSDGDSSSSSSGSDSDSDSNKDDDSGSDSDSDDEHGEEEVFSSKREPSDSD